MRRFGIAHLIKIQAIELDSIPKKKYLLKCLIFRCFRQEKISGINLFDVARILQGNKVLGVIVLKRAVLKMTE